MIGYIYKHTTPNGKSYIGQTIQEPDKRWKDGLRYKDSILFGRAIYKYGWVNIEHEILWEIEYPDKLELMDNLNFLETLEILSNDTLAPNGYNLNTGGKMRLPSDATRARMSESRKKFYESGGTAWNHGLDFGGMSGKEHSEETKKKMSETRKRIIKEKLSRGEKVFRAKGEYTHSAETRKKIGDAQRGKKRSDFILDKAKKKV